MPMAKEKIAAFICASVGDSEHHMMKYCQRLVLCLTLPCIFLFSNAVFADTTDQTLTPDQIAFQQAMAKAETGDAHAQMQVGIMYHYGIGVEQKYKRAGIWYRKAAEQNYSDAQNNLGTLCYIGRGVGGGHRYEQALMWFHKAADQGNAAAANNIGLMYEQGTGVKHDYAQAMLWYRKAADQGYAIAQYNLAILYDLGQGVAEDDKQAVFWYNKAAEQGYADAQKNLGYMYYHGDGAAQDYALSYRWFAAAAAQGHADAAYYRDILKQRGLLIEKQTP